MILIMTNNSLNQVLSSLSCSNDEANIYLFLAEHGVSNVSTIARGLHFSRTTTYIYIEKLLARNFIIKTKLAKRDLYEVCDPSYLLSEFEKMYKQGTQALSSLSLSLQNTTYVPITKMFVGQKELISIFDDIVMTLPKGGVYYRYTSRSSDQERAPLYQALRKEKEIERLVITSSMKASTKDKDANRFIKIVPKDFAFEDNVTVLIYANKIAHIDYNTMIGVVIESPKLARFQEKLFKLLWKKL